MKYAPAIIITSLAAVVLAFAAYSELHTVSAKIGAALEQVAK